MHAEFSSEGKNAIKSLGLPVLFGEYKKAGYQTVFQGEECWYDHWGIMLTNFEKYTTSREKEGFAKKYAVFLHVF